MWRNLVTCTVVGLLGGAPSSMPWAQAQPRQGGRFVGRVIDESRRPIEGVQVIVNRRDVRALTDSAGIFHLDASPSDSTVGFRRIGYQPILLTLRPLPPSVDTILVKLATHATDLPEVIVSAAPSKPLRYAGTTKYDEVFLRQRVGLGTLISRDAINGRFGVPTYELVRGVAGLRIWNGPPKRLRFARCSEPGGVAIFIDGTRQIPSSQALASRGGTAGLMFQAPQPRLEDEPEIEILSRISPQDIEMIEVFRGVSEIPGVFHWNGCAVIAIWTRWNSD
jgi:carboxypeptidase-like protein